MFKLIGILGGLFIFALVYKIVWDKYLRDLVEGEDGVSEKSEEPSSERS